MSRARSLANLANSGVFSADASTNRVGINSSAPERTLDVVGDGRVSGTLSIGGTINYEDVTSIDAIGVVTARGGVHIVSAGASIYSPANNELSLYTNSNERFRISSTGQVGIGTDFVDGNPYDAKLSVEGVTAITNSDQTILVRDSNNDDAVGRGGNIGFGAYVDGTMRTLAAIGGVKEDAGNRFDGNLVLYTRRTGQADLDERLHISSNGLVTVKNFTGTGLRLEGSGGNFQGMQLQTTDSSASQTRGIFIDAVNETGAAVANQVGRIESDGSSYWSWSTQPSGDRTSRRSERLRITSTGSVGIGVTNPSDKLQVNNGTVTVRNTPGDSGTGIFARIITHGYEWTGSAPNSEITQENFGLSITNNDQTTNSTLALAKFSTFRNSSSSNPGVVYIGAVDSGEGTNHSSDFIVALKGGDSTVTERLRVTHDGNLLINQDSKLHLEGTDDNDQNAIWKASTENTLFLTSRYNIANIIDSNGDDTASFWSVRHNATTLAGSGELMRVQSNGLVGIGTDNPNTLLHIKGTTSTQKFLTLSAPTFRNNYIGVREADNLELAADEDNEGDESSIRFRVDGTEVVRIESGDFDGAVGPRMMLGTAVDRGAMLHIAKNRGLTVIQNYLCIGDGFILKYIADSRLNAAERQRFTFVGHSRDSAIITISVVGRRGGVNTIGHFDAGEWKARVFSTSTQVTTLAGQGVQWGSGFTDSHFIFTDNGGYGYTIDIDNPTSANACDLSYDITIQNAVGNQHRLVSTAVITE